ncbi:MAG: 50S ribosomal protein L35 [Candidatus Omnitrophota bacterium]
MPKLKTRKAASKRVKLTKRGKIKISRAFRGHLLTSKSRKRKRSLNRKSTLSKTEEKKIRAMLHN